MICKNCGNKGLFYLEQRSKETTNIYDATRVALKCGTCDKFVKWCPKNERRRYMAQMDFEQIAEVEKQKNKSDYVKKLEDGLKEACNILNQYSKDNPFFYKDRYYCLVYTPENFILETKFKIKEV